jgi:arylsulfatase A-like enzyme
MKIKNIINRRNFLKQSGTLAVSNLFSIFLSNCQMQKPQDGNRPNILWIYVEDLSPLMSCFGVTINKTPTLDKLASDGVLFTKVFMPAPVCSPTRSAIITGTIQTTFGLHNHRSSRDERAPIYLPDGVKTIPELFREAGYYTFNKGKDDYNFMYDRERMYDGNYFYRPEKKYGGVINAEGDWNKRKPGQPFFGQIMLKGGKNQKKIDDPIDRKIVDLPPYYADHPVMREEWARHHDQIRITDQEVRDIIDQLKSDGLLENTVIFFFSDHGMRSFRHKQFLYDGGIHVPLIVTWYGNPGKIKANTVREDLVSGIDIATTSLALAGIDIPAYMEGVNLFDKNYRPREYIISARDRCDFTIDRIRCVRTKKFKYLKNFLTDRPYSQPNYRDHRETTKLMKRLYKEGKLNKVQARFMSNERPAEELYDLENDPHEIYNLAENPDYINILKRLRHILQQWMKETDDKGQYPEKVEALRVVYERLRDKCVNPEFDRFKKSSK